MLRENELIKINMTRIEQNFLNHVKIWLTGVSNISWNGILGIIFLLFFFSFSS